MKVNQITKKPTNKLSAAMLGAALIAIVRIIADTLWPDMFDGAFWVAISPLAIFAAGYFVKDDANVDLAQDGE